MNAMRVVQEVERLKQLPGNAANLGLGQTMVQFCIPQHNALINTALGSHTTTWIIFPHAPIYGIPGEELI